MVYEATTGQLILDRRVDEFLDGVDFATTGDREALRLRPAGPDSPIVMDPAIASASATVRGVRTEVSVELADTGVPIEEIAADFGLLLAVVKAALAYEWSSAALPATTTAPGAGEQRGRWRTPRFLPCSPTGLR